MKKLFYLLFAFAFIACEENPAVDQPVVKDPILTLSTEKMEFLHEGGEATISYTIENEKEGAKLAATCDAAWIENLTVGEEITFTVALNESRERETKIVVTYDSISIDVAIKQHSDGGDYTAELILNPADSLILDKEEGEASIGYEIKNPIDGTELTAVCEAEWISDIAINEKDITFNVTANNEELRRETTITVTYGTISKEIAVIQYSAADNNTVDLKMDWATRVKSSEYGLPNNYFLINFGDNYEQMQFQLALVNTGGMDTLPAGIYTPLTGSLLLDGTQLYIFADGEAKKFSDGRASVSVDENIYSFDLYLVGNDGVIYHIYYEGEVSRMATSIPGEETNFVPYAVYAVAWWSPGNFTIELYTNMAYCHSLDMYDLVGNSKNYLAEGIYVLAPDGGDGRKQYISNSGSKFSLGDGTYDYLADAQVEIIHNNKRTTTLKGYIKTLGGVVATFDWTGVIDGFDLAGYVAPEKDEDVNLTASYFKGDYYPASMVDGGAHNYYFTLSDMSINRKFPAPNSLNFNIDLYSETATADNSIPHGTYTFDASNSKAVGTAGGEKTLGFKVDASGDKHSKDYTFVSGTIVVSEGKIEAEFITDTDKKVTLLYEGDLTTVPYSEDNNYDYASRLYQDVVLNLTDVTLDAYNARNYYKTEGADYWQIQLFEDVTRRSGVKIFLAFLADNTVGGWDFNYKSVAIEKVGKDGDPADYMNAFIGGYLAGNVPAASWYQVLNGEGQPSSEMAPIVGGTINVESNDDGSKTFTFDCVDDAGFKITGTVRTKAPEAYTFSRSLVY